MKILPIENIWSEDKAEVGVEITHLADLHKLGLPVLQGLVVYPPIEQIQKFEKKYSREGSRLIEDNLSKIREEFLSLEVPESINEYVKDRKLEINSTTIHEYWKQVLEKWFQQLVKHIHLNQKAPLEKILQPQTIFFGNNIKARGTLDLDKKLGSVRIRVESGNVENSHYDRIKDHALKVAGHYNLPLTYHWVLDDDIYFVRVSEFVDDREVTREVFVDPSVSEPVFENVVTATKFFVKMEENLALPERFDGFLINPQRFMKQGVAGFVVWESAMSFPDKKVIVKLVSHLKEYGGEGGGNLYSQNLTKLQEQLDFIKGDSERYNNIDICIPFVRSVIEYKAVKRNLEKLGFGGRGTKRKLWLELSVPENFMNLEEYLVEGVFGVIINLDTLSSFVYGYNSALSNDYRHHFDSKVLINLFDKNMSLLKRSRIPVLVEGRLVSDYSLLRYLIENNIFGIVAQWSEIDSMQRMTSRIEGNLVRVSRV